MSKGGWTGHSHLTRWGQLSSIAMYISTLMTRYHWTESYLDCPTRAAGFLDGIKGNVSVGSARSYCPRNFPHEYLSRYMWSEQIRCSAKQQPYDHIQLLMTLMMKSFHSVIILRKHFMFSLCKRGDCWYCLPFCILKHWLILRSA